MKETIIGVLSVLVGIGELANGVIGGWIFVIIGALVLITRSFRYLKKADNKRKGRSNNEAVKSKDTIISTENKNRPDKNPGLYSTSSDYLTVDEIRRAIAETISQENYLDSLCETGGIDRKAETIKNDDNSVSGAVQTGTPAGKPKNLFGFHISEKEIQRLCSVDLGTIAAREQPEDYVSLLILEYKGNVKLVNAIEKLIQTLHKYRKDILIKSVHIDEIHDMYEPRIDEHFTLIEFQNAVKENRTLWQYGLGGFGDGYPISDVTSAWFPAWVDFSVDDIEAIVYLGDGRVSIKCSYGKKVSQHKKLSVDDVGARMIFESIIETTK